MLKDVGCQYVIVGHSERRALYKEDDALVARKFLAAQSHGLIPILCVGETLEERERGQTMRSSRASSLRSSTSRASRRCAAAVIAYEPVWAIGTGKNATPAQAQEVHAHIRTAIAARDAKIAADVAHPVRRQRQGRATPRSCSRCPMSTAAWSAARR